MTWLVDTNVLSELRKGKRTHPGVQRWYDTATRDDLFTSVLVVGELRRGVELLRRRDQGSAMALDLWLGRLVDEFQDRVLAVDAAIAERWGRLNVPDPLPTVDGLLAATALERGFVLVTRNTRDIESTGVRVINPFADA